MIKITPSLFWARLPAAAWYVRPSTPHEFYELHQVTLTVTHVHPPGWGTPRKIGWGLYSPYKGVPLPGRKHTVIDTCDRRTNVYGQYGACNLRFLFFSCILLVRSLSDGFLTCLYSFVLVSIRMSLRLVTLVHVMKASFEKFRIITPT